MSIEIEENLLKRREAAKFLAVTEGTLAVWACTNRYNLPIVRIGKRMIRYRLEDLKNFIERHRVVENKKE